MCEREENLQTSISMIKEYVNESPKNSAGWLWIMIDKEWLFKKRWVGNWWWSENEIKLNPKVIQQFLSVRYDGAHTHYYCTVMLMDAFCYAVTWGLSKWGFKMTSFTSLSIASTSSIGGETGLSIIPTESQSRDNLNISRLQSIWQINSRTQYNCDHIRANCISHRMENHKISLMDLLIPSSRN